LTPGPFPHTLPAWVKKRDGRLVPFEADCITQSLFAATEALGRTDAFLARELTDGVLHFLAADGTQTTPTTTEIADLVVKVVRELRHPQLARAFAERQQVPERTEVLLQLAPGTTAAEVVSQSLRAYSLHAVFSRDLAAAQHDGLLELSGLESPLYMAAGVLGPPSTRLLETFVQARQNIAGWLAVDGPEHFTPAQDAPSFIAQLGLACQATGLLARLQLNAAEPPPWAQEGAGGPLFAEPAAVEDIRTTALVEAWLEQSHAALSLDWHLGERDEHANKETLLRLAGAALAGRPVTFVFDLPRRPVSLGPGLDRKRTGLLMAVGLPLARLLDHTGITDDVDLFLRKLASLARWAVSAAVQKRQFLRQRHPNSAELNKGFMLDRARLMVAPNGLETAVRRLTGSGLSDSKVSLDVGRRLLQHLDDVLEVEGRRRLVDSVVEVSEQCLAAEAEQQLRALGRLHAVSGTGTAMVLLPEDEKMTAEHVVQLLRHTWQSTEVARLQFTPRSPTEQQLTLPIN
jgi:hypothetical protein